MSSVRWKDSDLNWTFAAELGDFFIAATLQLIKDLKFKSKLLRDGEVIMKAAAPKKEPKMRIRAFPVSNDVFTETVSHRLINSILDLCISDVHGR